MSNTGKPVLHVYLIFIVCCLTYGAYSLYKYVEYLEDTIMEQNHAIELKNQETAVLRMYIDQLNTYNPPTGYQQSYDSIH